VRRADVIELIRVDLPDHTDGAFDVVIESDDGGSHIVIKIEDHTESHAILKEFSTRFSDQRIILMLVPEGSLHWESRSGVMSLKGS
tara:strand:- start:11 stop:268 length:258 start_codon:yes stop_codon:yes gene_type:complete